MNAFADVPLSPMPLSQSKTQLCPSECTDSQQDVQNQSSPVLLLLRSQIRSGADTPADTDHTS